MTLFKSKNGKLDPIKEISFDLEKKIQNIFNLTFVRSEFQLGRFRIDTVAFDKESSSFVIIEYKNGRDSGLFEQGLAYLEIMLDRGADFITEYNENLNENLKKRDVDWTQSKIIFVAPSFNKNQRQAANLDLHIELWEVHLYQNDIIEYSQIETSDTKIPLKVSGTKSSTISKVTREIMTYDEEYHFRNYASEKTRKLYNEIKERILALGDNIEPIFRKKYIAFKTNYNFVYLNLQKNAIHVDLSMRISEVQDPKGTIRNMEGIGHYGAGYSRISVKDFSEIPYMIGLIEQSYTKSMKNTEK